MFYFNHLCVFVNVLVCSPLVVVVVSAIVLLSRLVFAEFPLEIDTATRKPSFDAK